MNAGRAEAAHRRYVLDTNVLYWRLRHRARLSSAADAVFALAEAGEAILIVPAIAVAELYFLTVKLRDPFNPKTLMDRLEALRGIRLSQLGRDQLERLDRFPEIPEMHDRLIAVEAEAFDAALVTKDETLRNSPSVQTIW